MFPTPLVILALVALGGGIAIALRKKSSVANWLTDYWAGRQRLPQDFDIASHGADTTPFLVDYGIDAHSPLPATLEVITSPETEVYAARASVVSWVGTLSGYGPAVGLSHLLQDQESTFYAGLDPTVGLGQLVQAGEEIGVMLQSVHLAFKVFSTRIPDIDSPALTRAYARDPYAWLQRRSINISPQED